MKILPTLAISALVVGCRAEPSRNPPAASCDVHCQTNAKILGAAKVAADWTTLTNLARSIDHYHTWGGYYPDNYIESLAAVGTRAGVLTRSTLPTTRELEAFLVAYRGGAYNNYPIWQIAVAARGKEGRKALVATLRKHYDSLGAWWILTKEAVDAL